MNAELLRRYLEYYDDLGIKTLYRRASPVTKPILEIHADETTKPELVEPLFRILEDIGDCRRCRLHEQRTKIVFGVGNEQTKLVFVGEGPGADEDAQGIPFVGRAGQLLTQMIEGTAS